MTAEKKEILTQMADLIRKECHTPDNNKNLEDTVIKLGGRVSYTLKLRRFDDCQVATRKGMFTIEVSQEKGYEERTVDIARGIGYMLGYLDKLDTLWNGYLIPDEAERSQASAFIPLFLMPEKLFLEQLRAQTNGDFVDTGKVAKFFHVPMDYAIQRGKQLDYLETARHIPNIEER